MAATAPPPTSPRRHSFLSKLFGRKNKSEDGAAAPPPYHQTGTEQVKEATANEANKVDGTNTGAPPSDGQHDAAKSDDAKANEVHTSPASAVPGGEKGAKEYLHKAETAVKKEEDRVKNHLHKAEEAAHKEGQKIKDDWAEAQKPQTAEDKYGDLM